MLLLESANILKAPELRLKKAIKLNMLQNVILV